ncbi:cytochrome P450 phenylacetate hydroxylase [Trichophyton violaceum]|uniref:Cytochrome P450 phenylacetate hydroxylase n=1 Tax=Trichophyton violaceum TaxID=34388 RepID=A0A178FFQ1_TRIVO|nr:cytochrome P450 phenylacetate hydroxylase [Trichophyton violaceum]
MVFAKTFSNLVDYPLESLLILSCVLSTVYILSNEFVRYMARIKGFKGPPGLLMIGNLEQIQENAAEQYRQWSADLCKDTVQNSQALSSRPEFYTFHKVVSNTAGTTIGTSPYSESLKRRRKGAAAALNKPSVQSYVGHLDLETKDFIAELLKYGHAGNTAIDPMVMIQRLSLSLALTLNWGVRMASQEEELFKEITHVEDEISRFRSTTGNLQDYIPLLRLNPFNFGSKKAAEMRDRRDKYLQHLNAGLEERMAKNEHQPCIQANIMLDEDAKLNKEELTSISLTMLSGGLDTLTTLIAWSIALFSQRPDIQDKAADAIKEFYSQDQPLCDAVDDQKCEYIVALGKECLRYFTVLRLALPRTSIKDITYEGKVIPKGTVFFLNAWACNMDPYIWTDPEVFRPERWIERPEAPLFTYGLGYRMCAGSLLANREIYLILIRMLNSFRITSVEKVNTHPIHGNSDPTSLVAIPNKYKVKFIPKNKTALDAAISNFSSK